MNCTHGNFARKPRRMSLYLGVCAVLGGTALVLLALATSGHAESTRRQGSPAGSAVNASARLDFRVVVRPSIELTMQAKGWRAQGNSGALTIQRSTVRPMDGRLPGAGVQLPTTIDGEQITIAAP
jgi:hypothetical protein